MIDYLMTGNDDLLIANGDFVKGDSDKQHQRSLLLAEKGDYKQAPIATVGLASYINDDAETAELLREIRLRFSDDGMTVDYIDKNLLVVAHYGK